MLRPRQASGRVKIPKQKRNSQKTRLGKPCRVKFKGTIYADVAELADALDLGSSAERRMSSNLFARTNKVNIGGYSVMVTH